MPIYESRFICLRRGTECICLSGRTTAAGWQGRLIAMQRDGWEVVELEDGAVLEVNAADWIEVLDSFVPEPSRTESLQVCVIHTLEASPQRSAP